jgi:hypothetical protein
VALLLAREVGLEMEKFRCGADVQSQIGKLQIRVLVKGDMQSEVANSKLGMGREYNTEPWRSAVDVAVSSTISM